jgi:molecular chaperone Hsp31 and glyoxalase 3
MNSLVLLFLGCCVVQIAAFGGAVKDAPTDTPTDAPAQLSMEPTLLADGTYEPSPFALSVAVPPVTKYVKVERDNVYTGQKKILVVATDDGRMAMTNGKVFSSGNHPVETMVPLMHFRDAGFEFEFATVSGGPVVIEMWAFPSQDENVKKFYEEIKTALANPSKLEDISTTLEGYAGIFIPGGHGAMINLPESAALGVLLREANKQSMPTAVLCHGPAALLAATVDGDFPYVGYEAVTFTDAMDKQSPSFGYLPGDMGWYLQEKLNELGMKVTNQEILGATKVDRELITGDGPPAAHPFGLVATDALLKYVSN